MKILIVSSKWKYIGAKTIKEPFKKNNNGLKNESLLIKKEVSSFPKWYDATIKKNASETEGNITQKIIIKIANEM